jgi:hypothetical protein
MTHELSHLSPLDVDGRVDSKGVKFIGKASLQSNGMWRCLANVGGCLCIVEADITGPEGLDADAAAALLVEAPDL